MDGVVMLKWTVAVTGASTNRWPRLNGVLIPKQNIVTAGAPAMRSMTAFQTWILRILCQLSIGFAGNMALSASKMTGVVGLVSFSWESVGSTSSANMTKGVCLCTELNALDAEDGDKVAIIVKHIVVCSTTALKHRDPSNCAQNCEKSKPEKPKFKGVNSPAIVSVPEQASFSFEGAQNDEIHTPSENVDDNEPDAANSASSKLVSEHELFGQVCTAIFSSIDSITALEQQLADAKSRLTKQHDCMLWGFAESLDKLNVSLECKSATQSLDQYLSDVRHTLKMNSKTFNNTARPFLKEVIEQVGLDEMDEGQADVKVVIGGLKLSKKILSPYMEKVTKGVELDNKDGIASEQGVPSHYSSW